nr:reverse transcriptase domain-containing protein [Tanacetum cinerariifolium]
YKDLLRACPHHGFTELHQLDTFYNALNPANQDSLNSAAGGNLLERRTQDVLTIIKNKSKIAKLTHAVNQQTSVVTTAMIAILKQFQATPPPASVKAVKEILLLVVVLIRIISVSLPVASLSQNLGIILKDTLQ